MVKYWGLSMIVMILLCSLTCIFCGFLYFIVLYGITKKTFNMLCSKEDYEIIDNNYLPPYATNNSQKAALMCKDYKDPLRKRLDYQGFNDCRLFKSSYETEYACKNSCSGFGDCVSVCPQKAITIRNHIAIISESCNGCGLCVSACPQKLIKLVPNGKEAWIDCIAPDCYEVNEKILTKNENLNILNPLQKKVVYSKTKGFKRWKSWVNI